MLSRKVSVNPSKRRFIRTLFSDLFQHCEAVLRTCKRLHVLFISGAMVKAWAVLVSESSYKDTSNTYAEMSESR